MDYNRHLFSAAILSIVLSLSSVSINAQENCQSCCDSCEPGRRAGCQYDPKDPWNRNRMFLKQTGHFGWFYNCDCEEDKRMSPYICWKQSDSPFSGERFFESMRCDFLRIKQRILHGSKDCCGNRLRKTPRRSNHGNSSGD